MNHHGRMQIGELARRAGVNPKAIRYYESIGLLPEPPRTASGYRMYGNDDRNRLDFILRAKAIGLTLDEIGEVAQLREEGEEPCGHVLALVERKIEAVDEQIRQLQSFRRELVTLRDQAEPERCSDARFCSIIELHRSERETAPAG